MSAYAALVLNNVCRSNHHRLAIMALDHLKAHENERWRDLFLKYHPTYLKGSKAPDEEFKDFKNHVCHPENNFWGGAPQAAAEWYKRTVRALAEKDWETAAWNAGVMSHYIVDPCQPFHTGQSEAEGTIHRPAEWSFSKAFPEIKLIIDQHTGWPDVKVPSGDDWLGEMVRQAATNSNKHYHAMIDHYNLDAARKKPEAGLDQELKDIVARQMAYASVMLARVMDKAIAESKAEAPKSNLAIATLITGIKKPLHLLLKNLDHQEDRKVVEAQYKEFTRTGKVRETLGEDDKVVRMLHADEVLDKHLSSIDAEWPREHGTAHGTGAEPRAHKKIKLKNANRKIRDEGRAEEEGQGEMVLSKPEKGEKADKAPRIRLTREASIVDAPSIGPKTAGRLNTAGIKTVADLLALSPEEAAARLKQSHINARVIKDWQAQALLACTVPEISGTAAQLLVGAGVHTAHDLANANVKDLVALVKEFADTKEGEQVLRTGAPPDEAKIANWIAAAKSIAA